MNRLGVIIPAGGSGSRMGRGLGLPKQFLMLGTKPVLAHSIEEFSKIHECSEIVVSLPAEHLETWARLCEKYNVAPHKTCVGGATRTGSVKSALAAIGSDCTFIAIHDGVRPLVSNSLIINAMKTAIKHGSAIPVTKIGDSVRRITLVDMPKKGSLDVDCEQISHPEERENLRAVQTPQIFRADILRDAYQRTDEQSGGQHFTDDATVVQAAGYTLMLCGGERRNIKITEPVDMIVAEALLNI